MIIPIDDKYRIAADARAWSIQSKDKKGNWTSFAWYTTIGACIRGLSDRLIRTSEAETLEEAIAAVDRVLLGLSRALSPVVKVERLK